MVPGGGIMNFGKLKLGVRATPKLCRGFFKPRVAPGSTSYYVVLPEVPLDTKETNPLLIAEDHPKFNKITPDLCITGSAKRSIEYDIRLENLVENLKESKQDLTFNKIFDPIEKLQVPLNYALATTKQLSYVMLDTPFDQAFMRVYPQVENSKSQRWLNKDLHAALKELNASQRDKMEANQRRLVDLYILEGRLCGIEFLDSEKAKFLQLLLRLAELKKDFRTKVNMSSNLFSHTLYDSPMISEFPKDFLSQISLNKDDPMRGPWKLTLEKGAYDTAMAYCSDRMTRWNLWYAYNSRASTDHSSQNLSNHRAIEEIRSIRNDVARMLKYKSFAHMSMETKMAGCVESVTSFINRLKGTFQPLAQEELTRLQEFAARELFPHKIEPWDVPYWRRRQMESLYKLDVADLKNYFPMHGVLEFLFNYCRSLFGLRFEDHTGEVEVWNEDVKFYKLYDNSSNKFLSAFYFDPYSRSGSKLKGAWCESGRERSDLLGSTAFSYFCMNLPKPDQGSPCLLTFEQLQLMFYLFGRCLQQLATTVPYAEISGQRNVELDAVNTSAILMKMILNTKDTLKSMGKHHITGEPLGDDVIDTLLHRNGHMTSYDNLLNLYYSALDMELHLNAKKGWYSVMENVWGNFMPFKLDDGDKHVCSMNPIFSDNHPAGYYSHKWSEMLASNMLSTFNSAKEGNAGRLEAVGKRYRDTVLALGGSAPASEIFGKFQGEEPNVLGLMVYYLKKNGPGQV